MESYYVFSQNIFEEKIDNFAAFVVKWDKLMILKHLALTFKLIVLHN